jgi:hypothetical protein
MAQFSFQVLAVGQRPGKFFTINRAELFSQPMNRHASCPFIQPQARRHCGIVNRSVRRQETALERLKIVDLSGGGKFIGEAPAAIRCS